MATFFDQNTTAPPTDFVVTVSWGDLASSSTGLGTVSVAALGGGASPSRPAMTMPRPALIALSVQVNDIGGSSAVIAGAALVHAPWWINSAASGVPASDPQNAQQVSIGEATVDLNTGGLRLSQALDFDRSGGTAVGGNPALVYNSATVNPPVVNVVLASDPGGAVPQAAQLQLTWDGAPLAPATFDTSTWVAGGVYVLPLAVGSAGGTGEHSWSVTATLSFADGSTQTISGSGQTAVVDQTASPYGAGWGLDGIPELYPGSTGVLWVTGQGDSRFFAGNGNGTFTSPAEDLGTLKRNAWGTYTYTARGRTTYTFSAGGLLTTVLPPDGPGPLYQYDNSGRLVRVTAPDGGVTTLRYDGGTGLLDEISEPGGRTVTLTHNGTDLTAITDAASFTRTLTYDNGHHAIADNWDPLAAAFAYNGQGLLVGVDQGLGSVWTIVPAAAVSQANAWGRR